MKTIHFVSGKSWVNYESVWQLEQWKIESNKLINKDTSRKKTCTHNVGILCICRRPKLSKYAILKITKPRRMTDICMHIIKALFSCSPHDFLRQLTLSRPCNWFMFSMNAFAQCKDKYYTYGQLRPDCMLLSLWSTCILCESLQLCGQLVVPPCTFCESCLMSGQLVKLFWSFCESLQLCCQFVVPSRSLCESCPMSGQLVMLFCSFCESCLMSCQLLSTKDCKHYESHSLFLYNILKA